MVVIMCLGNASVVSCDLFVKYTTLHLSGKVGGFSFQWLKSSRCRKHLEDSYLEFDLDRHRLKHMFLLEKLGHS